MRQQGGPATPRNIYAGILECEHLWAVGATDLMMRAGSSTRLVQGSQGRELSNGVAEWLQVSFRWTGKPSCRDPYHPVKTAIFHLQASRQPSSTYRLRAVLWCTDPTLLPEMLSSVNLTQARLIWKKSLSEDLSRPGWPTVGIPVEGWPDC